MIAEEETFLSATLIEYAVPVAINNRARGET